MSKKKGPSAPSARIRKKERAGFQSKLEDQHNERISKSRRKTDQILAVLFVCMLGLVPLLMRARVSFFIAPRIISPIVDSGYQGNLFTYYKWLLVIVISIIAVILLLDKVVLQKYSIRSSYINVPLLILVILVLASIITAPYKSVALFGLYNQGDGALIFLAYLALFMVAANTQFTPWFEKGVNIALLIFIFSNVVIALAHFSGHDLLQWPSIRRLLSSNELAGLLQGSLTSTMNHNNYVSGFSAALFGFFMGNALLQEERWKQFVLSLAVLASFTLVLASLSRSGFVTIIVLTPLLILTLVRSKNRRSSFSVLVLVTLGCLTIFSIMDTVNPRVGQETLGLSALKPISIRNELNINQMIERCVPHKMQVAESGPSTDARVADTEPIVNFQLPNPGWGGGTGRIYIWSETMKLVKVRPFLGYGLGTLAYYFPHDDINKVSNLNDYGTIVTKPHNTYLAIAFGLGVPALIVVLILLFSHFVYTIKRLGQVELSSANAFQVSLFLFFCAFSVQALFNDTVIDAGAIFWTLFGVSVALNMEQNQPLPLIQ